MSEKARVLVIDDDEGVRESIATALRDEGYVVDTAKDGKEAIENSNANFYNLALIDIRLPDMEGIKLLSSLRETTPRMVKIILTGYPALQNAIEAVNKGADAYITKPVNMDQLLEKIKDHLAKQQEMKQYGQDKLAEFVETRFREIDTEELGKKD
jgi:two-component system response regulator AtoC